MNLLKQVGNWALANPVKAGLAVGVLVGIAWNALSGGDATECSDEQLEEIAREIAGE